MYYVCCSARALAKILDSELGSEIESKTTPTCFEKLSITEIGWEHSSLGFASSLLRATNNFVSAISFIESKVNSMARL